MQGSWSGVRIAHRYWTMLDAARILIADDQPDVLMALRLLLKGEGWETEAVSDPDSALDRKSVV